MGTEETGTRRIVAGLYMSLDGVVESPQDWHFDYLSDEMEAVVGELVAGSDTLLLGRKTYQEFAAVWPHQTGELADGLNGMPKLVASTTLDSVEWSNSELLGDDVVAALTALKKRPGRDINLTGSITLTRELLRAGLVDELNLLVHPVVLGSGARLFTEETGKLPLALVHSATFASGVVHLRYRPV
ncbi:dihydrofolate reductase family protein [Actinorhabdospora filicis]|nr:dihydrofolate reductase family protein [Actinorhabdospora filicis]